MIGSQTEYMADLFYILLTVVFFYLCWLFTKACDRL